MKKYLLIFLTSLLPLVAWAEKPTTEGTEFWLTFMNNYRTSSGSSEMELKLIFSSRQNTTVMVQNPQTGWSQSMQVSANTIAEMVVPRNQCYTYSAETVEKRGLVITSSSPIALYASNFREHTYDATIVLPINGIGTDYVIQAYENVILVSGDKFPREFAVVATEDGTQVTITPHARTTGGKLKNVPFTISLNKGETYQVMSEDTGNDFSGSHVESNKPVAVFSGHSCVNIPTGNPWCDHIVEQQMPTPMWGRQFVVTKTKGQYGDRVLVTARDNGTVVKVNGTVKATLAALESYEFRLTDNSAYIETSAPATCFSYIEGARANNMFGDPSSVHVSPLEQMIDNLTFATFETSVSRTHFINIVSTTAGAAAMTLDGKSIASQFQPVTGNSQYRYSQIHISHGTHTLQTTKDGFVGHVYGLGHCESYAYTFGSSTIPLDGQIVVDGEPRTDIEYNEERCYKTPITFQPHTNVEYNSVHWDFGDGTQSTQPVVKHTYPSAGDYRVQMIVQNNDGKDTAYTNLHFIETLRDTVYATICDGDKYVIAGQEFTTKGKHNITLTSSGGCDSIVTLVLDVASTYFKTEEATVNRGMSYRWHWKWFREEGYYRDTLTSSQGCDSIFELHLTLNDPTEIMHDTICYQPTYTFRDHEFTLPPVDGYENQEYIDYTLEYRDNVKCITYKMLLAILPLGSGEITLNDTIQEGQTYDFFGETLTLGDTYYKTIEKGMGCAQDYTLNLTVLPFPIIKTEAVLCTSDSYEFRGKFYDKPGVYNDTVFTPAGIEAIYRLTLTDARSHTDISVQTTGSYEFNGEIFTESGNYTFKFTNYSGCDSIVTLHLGIGEPCQVTEEVNMSLCEGEHIKWNGIDCTTGHTYTKQLKSSGGCDSIATLIVTALPKPVVDLDVKICRGDYYLVGGEKLKTEGPHTVVLKTEQGCDSTVNVNISFKESYNQTLDVTIEEGQEYPWDGDIYTRADRYVKGYLSADDCDSVVTLNLSVVPHCVTERTDVRSICIGNKYDFYGELLDKPDTYTHLVENVDCDTLVTLNLIVNQPTDSVETAVICAGETYRWHGRDYSQSTTVSETLVNSAGCDSVCTLNLTVNPILYGDTSVVLCDAPSFTWHGEKYSTSGDYPYTYSSHVTGCDSIVTMHLSLLNSTNSIENVVICEGESHWWHGREYRQTTVENETLRNAAGCDSICTLNLTVNPRLYGDTIVTLCDEASFTWHGERFTASGDYPYTYSSHVTGCDSIVTMHLSLLNSTDSIENVVICEGESHWWHGRDYTQSTTVSETLVNSAGCDSVCTLNLTVNPILYGDTSVVLCDAPSFTWHGERFSTSGDYPYRYSSRVTGCDSIVTLHLSLLQSTDSVETAVICAGETYRWHGRDYTQSTTVSETLVNSAGCDSVCTLNLTVNPILYGDTSVVLCDAPSFTWHGERFSTSGDYPYRYSSRVSGCDSIVTLHLSLLQSTDSVETAVICAGETYRWHGRDYTQSTTVSETLVNSAGCDSVCTLNLTVNPTYNIEFSETINEGEVYRWEGYKIVGSCANAAEGNCVYDKTKSYRTITGCDSILTLHLSVIPKIEIFGIAIDEQCGGPGVLEIVIQNNGQPAKVQLAFSQNALSNGFQNGEYDLVGDRITIPYNARAGHYSVEVTVMQGDMVRYRKTHKFTLLYPSTVLEQGWLDAVLVLTHDYNGGYDFTAFQWYKNGEKLQGETGPYIYQPLTIGAAYQALLTDTEGLTLMTCPLIAVPFVDITLYPTEVQRNNIIRCHVSQPADIMLYSAVGQLIKTYTVPEGDSDITAPETSGLFMAKIVTINGDKKIIKIIVK